MFYVVGPSCFLCSRPLENPEDAGRYSHEVQLSNGLDREET